MISYYVVRNKKTGMYYRGNYSKEWGTYYNKAIVYMDKKHAENTVSKLSTYGEQAEVVEIRISEVRGNDE